MVVPSIDSVLVVLEAYEAKKVTAAEAAKVLVDYMVGTGKPLNMEAERPLRDAIDAEIKRRARP